ncbi:hypothetical protein [Deinococcus roseus]|uniref:Extracellular solute-binding protein n=1 Tax=Deinococcus roseus TaxID=392414 RepID=A0ABQ2CW75_9DEIO|nr:hypothetical protein [Deinococcus roseus]GGJ26595.1 hypothetical protein GCM10008938_10930 [Deinococcus roseus]
MKKTVAPLLTLLLIAGVGFALYQSLKDRFASAVLVKGVIGSEKEDFFKDPELTALLKKKGFQVEVQKAGSRQIATTFDLNGMDFAFPSGAPAAEKLRKDKKARTTFSVFFTPMVVASWQPIASILEKNGLAQNKGKYDLLDLEKLLQAIKDKKRWNSLKDSGAYPVNKPILISSTDVTKSNSGAMYLALASYIFNGDNVVQSAQQAAQVLDDVKPLFLQQGYQESTSQGPFEDYFLIGMGKTPMVMVYESQYLDKALKNALRPGMRLMYPNPGMFTKHILVPFTDSGTKFGELLSNDPDIQRIAAKYGLRSQNQQVFEEVTRSSGLARPEAVADIVDPPTYDVLENMIQGIEQSR